MVVKGRGKYPKKKPVKLQPPTKNIQRIASLSTHDASDKALELIHEVAQLVAPVMHHYNFHVGLLCEMYPKNHGLLGLNVNRGQKICLRLRSPTDSKWFLERDEIVGTMLHELTHNIFGPHDAKFYKHLDELKDKYTEFQIQSSLQNSSYPNNFSNNIPKRSSSTAAKIKYTGKVSKLGTNDKSLSNATAKNMRILMLEAAERRRVDSMKCAQLDEDKMKNVPDDDILNITEVILLDSESENDDNSRDNGIDDKEIQNNANTSKIKLEKSEDIKEIDVVYID